MRKDSEQKEAKFDNETGQLAENKSENFSESELKFLNFVVEIIVKYILEKEGE